MELNSEKISGLDEILAQISAEQKPHTFRRICYKPYNMDIALSVWQKIGSKIIGKDFQIYEGNKEIIENLIKYAHGDQNCIFDLEKVLALIGPTGTGKTDLIKIFSFYLNIHYLKNNKAFSFQFKFVTAREIILKYATNGHTGINNYLIFDCLCIDDIGSESKISNFYGNSENVVEFIIGERYDMGKITHLTSNYTKEYLQKEYGDRFFSRICETTNFIEVKGKDFRLE